MTSARTTWLQARRAKLVASLAIAEATYNKLLAKTVDEGSFNDGVGSQSFKRPDLDMLKKQIDTLNAQIEAIDGRLNGSQILGMQVSRW